MKAVLNTKIIANILIASIVVLTTASIIQGCSIRPAVYFINTSDLQVVTPGQCICKLTDDTYLIIFASNIASRPAEMNNTHVNNTWAAANNLTLNCEKSCEILFIDLKHRRHIDAPAELPNIYSQSWQSEDTWSHKKSIASEHIENILKSCSQSMYALRLLKLWCRRVHTCFSATCRSILELTYPRIFFCNCWISKQHCFCQVYKLLP